MGKNRKNRQPSQVSVAELMKIAGEEFVPKPRLEIAASDSAHQVAAGEWNGQSVIVKPYRSKGGFRKATNEFKVTNHVIAEGLPAFEPLKVIDLRHQRAALYISRYVPDLIGSHTLTYEEDPTTPKGRAVAEAAGDIAFLLGTLHGKKIKHGDFQLKNTAFLAQDVFSGSYMGPSVHDFENGVIYQGSFNGIDFADAAKQDVQTLFHSMGTRQFGGHDSIIAEDVARENVVNQYLLSDGAALLGPLATAKMIDKAMINFHNGRDNKSIYNTPLALH